MKRILFFIVEILIFSFTTFQGCMWGTDSANKSKDDNTIPVSAAFDSLEHYSIDIDLFKIGELEDKNNKSEKEQLLLSVLSNNQVNISLLPRLKEIGYASNLVDKSLYKTIDALFFLKARKDNVESSCIPEFRDILVFYKDKQCVGIAKICFDCKTMVSWSEKLNFAGFGDLDDYDKLHPLLGKN